uniref:Uncharacterized protein n=1 Tax=Gouania willdenowi TaxID=441366 RepID=A0A8C5H7N3_GOUWI
MGLLLMKNHRVPKRLEMFQNTVVPRYNAFHLQLCSFFSSHKHKPPVKKDIVLKNAKSWAKLMEESIVSSPIKSSKDVFQYFRKAALEKEQREKMLQKKRLEEQREKERDVPGLRESQPNISWTPDDVYGHRHEQQTSAQQKHSSTMRSVSEEREMEKRKEQERRRKYAVSHFVSAHYIYI